MGSKCRSFGMKRKIHWRFEFNLFISFLYQWNPSFQTLLVLGKLSPYVDAGSSKNEEDWNYALYWHLLRPQIAQKYRNRNWANWRSSFSTCILSYNSWLQYWYDRSCHEKYVVQTWHNQKTISDQASAPPTYLIEPW